MELYAHIETLDIENKVVVIRFATATESQFKTLLKLSNHLQRAGARKTLIVQNSVTFETLTDEELLDMGLKRI